MKVYSLYLDFFKFLEKIPSPSEKWKVYFDYYYKPHKEFLDTYFSHSPLIDFWSLKERVEAIKASDYSLLKNLISVCPPERIIVEAYARCRRIVSFKKEPGVYLFVGFFSPDAFVMDFRRKPVICFGLERFRDFRLLRILFAHECAHFLLNLGRGEVPEEKKWKWRIVSEGIASYFSFLAFPSPKFFDHFLFSRDLFNWCAANESFLRDIYASRRYTGQELMDFYEKGNPEMNLPPRAAKYLGFQAVKNYLAEDNRRNIDSLLSSRELALSLEL